MPIYNLDMRLVYIFCSFVLLSFFSLSHSYAQRGDDGYHINDTNQNNVWVQTLTCDYGSKGKRLFQDGRDRCPEWPIAQAEGQREPEETFTQQRRPSQIEQCYLRGGDQASCEGLAPAEQQSRGDHHPPVIEQAPQPNFNTNDIVDKCKNSIELGDEGRVSSTENATSCIKEECSVNGKLDNKCYVEATTEITSRARSINTFSQRYNSCVEEKSPEANQCCGGNLAESSCGSDAMATIVRGTNDISQTIQIAASYTSPAAVCQANKKAYQIASGLLLTATAICAKAATACNAGCSLSGLSDTYCDDMLGSTNGKNVNNDSHIKCKKMARIMKTKNAECYSLQAGNALKAGLTHTTNKYQKKFNECSNELVSGGTLDCTLEENKADPKCNPATLCDQPGSENLPLCQGQTTADTGVGQTLDSIDTTSNGDLATASDSATPFGEEGEEQGFDPLAQAINNDDSGSSSQASGSGGGNVSASGGSGSGGGSGGRAGKAGAGKDKNILKGTSSGNGYVSRFRGGSGGGGYKAKSYSRSSGGRGSKGFPKFNLKKFLPKSKKITKGRLKGYNRLPSGNLMVPQNLDIFDVHHKSYQNACKRGQIIKGCGPAASKKLGLNLPVRDLNSRYKAQLALQKESQKQRLSRSGIRVRSLKNNISTQARTTYYQIKYLNKNKLRKLPAKDPLAALGKKDTKKYKDWHKMQNWINSKTKAVSTPSSSRIPANVK